MEVSNDITNNFMKNVLEKYFNQEAKILNTVVKDFKFSHGYCSDIKKICVTYKLKNEQGNKQLHLIAKCHPKDKYLAKFVDTMKFFECELQVYGIVLPKLYSFNYREKISAPVYYVTDKPQPLIILEDLSLNCRLVSDTDGLDLKHCFLVVEKLAYFHAASVALHEQDSTILPRLNKTIFRKNDLMLSLMKICYENAIEMTKTEPGLHKYTDKLKNAQDNVYDKLFNIPSTNSKFKVLNHGDCQIRNILFHYNEDGSLKDLAFIDFQSSCFVNPYLDLHYFLVTSVKLEVMAKCNDILDHYFHNLIKNLKKLQINVIPKREDVDEGLCSLAYYGFSSCIALLPIVISNQRNDASLKNFLNDGSIGSFRHHCFSNQEYRKKVIYYIPFYDNLGVFHS